MSSTTSTRPADAEGLEAFLVTREPHRRCVELLYFLAYYHLNDSKLSMGDSVNFGMPVWADSQLDHAVLSFPYIEQDGFAELRGGGRHSMISWIVPITKAEREYKKANGLDALEDALEHNQVDYLNPNRAQVI